MGATGWYPPELFFWVGLSRVAQGTLDPFQALQT